MSSEPNVQRGTAEDAEVLARLLRRFNDEYEDETPDHELLLERIPALIASGTRDAYLGELYVAPDRRGGGFGRAMLDAVIEEARGLYESAGFTNFEGGDDGPSMLYYERDL